MARSAELMWVAAALSGYLESVREHHAGLHSLLSMRRMDANRRKASAFRLRFSQSFTRASASTKPSEGAFDNRSFWEDDEAASLIRAFDDFNVHACQYLLQSAAEHRALITAIRVKLQKEWVHAEQGCHDECAAIAILNVSRVHDGVDQQALGIDENVPLLTFDLLSCVITGRINRTPPFSALFTL